MCHTMTSIQSDILIKCDIFISVRWRQILCLLFRSCSHPYSLDRDLKDAIFRFHIPTSRCLTWNEIHSWDCELRLKQSSVSESCPAGLRGEKRQQDVVIEENLLMGWYVVTASDSLRRHAAIFSVLALSTVHTSAGCCIFHPVCFMPLIVLFVFIW